MKLADGRDAESRHKWRRDNYAKRSVGILAKRKTDRRIDPRRELVVGAKRRATQKGLPHNITVDDISIPEFCPALGIPLVVGEGKTHDGSPTIDRIVNELGYVKGNVVVVSHRANSIKRDSSIPELRSILKFYEGLKQ